MVVGLCDGNVRPKGEARYAKAGSLIHRLCKHLLGAAGIRRQRSAAHRDQRGRCVGARSGRITPSTLGDMSTMTLDKMGSCGPDIASPHATRWYRSASCTFPAVHGWVRSSPRFAAWSSPPFQARWIPSREWVRTDRRTRTTRCGGSRTGATLAWAEATRPDHFLQYASDRSTEYLASRSTSLKLFFAPQEKIRSKMASNLLFLILSRK